MIFIAVKFPVRPELSDNWLSLVADFTQATRSEPGNVFFEWSRSADNPHEYVLLEGFRDGDAGGEHVNSDHFQAGLATMSGAISDTPRIISVEVPQDGWGPMAELKPS